MKGRSSWEGSVAPPESVQDAECFRSDSPRFGPKRTNSTFLEPKKEKEF